MPIDIEAQLAERLHEEAARLVPVGQRPPLPDARPSWRRRVMIGSQSRWRAPVLVAAAVLVIALVTTAVVQWQRAGSASPAAGAAPVSPVQDRQAAPFSCFGGLTTSAARTDSGIIGITSDTFCMTVNPARQQVVGSGLRASGALRAFVGSESVVGGVVDPTVTAVRFVPSGGDDAGRATVELYRLGSLRGFALTAPDGGTLLLYSGSTVVARQRVPNILTDLRNVSSSPAPVSEPTGALIPDPWPDRGSTGRRPTAPVSDSATVSSSVYAPAGGRADSTAAQHSYPPGEGPSPRAGAWPTNARGQTYGSNAHANAETGEPDLIAAIATNGREGYVLRTELEGPSPTSISDALAQNSAPSRTIPVYQSDGLTQIGAFVVGGRGSSGD